MAKVWFEISDGLTFVRWRAVAGYTEYGRFIRTDAPDQRTGAFLKWHVLAPDGLTAFPHNGQQIPADAETTSEIPDGPSFCTQCLSRVLVSTSA